MFFMECIKIKVTDDLMCILKCSTFKGTRTRAAVVFIIGFWLLDLANNTVQVQICLCNVLE